MRLQRLRGGVVLNALPFGRALRALARDLVGPFADAVGYGFQDGGCLIFATGLREWSGGALNLAAAYTPARGGQAQHVVASLEGRLYLDSDGAGTEADLLAKLAALEMLREAHVAPYDPAGERVIPSDPALSSWIADRLRRRFGTFDAAALDLAGPAASPPPLPPPPMR